ncbi:SEC-C metal-binding domain-containing protein [Fictibacillus sp. Mic-4]|uniref:YecA family protein n=1 Tax=Fictibacillus sp. Mic-4 TaxID=3132826 RepID=UPI003CF6F188
MNNRMDKKTRNQLLKALENAKTHHRQLEIRREQRLWKKIELPCKLYTILRSLTKNELDVIRKNLNLRGMSSLKKDELARELERAIPICFKLVLSVFDQERYELIRKIIKNSGVLPIDDEFPISKIESLMGYGIIFPVIKKEKKILTIPTELCVEFEHIDDTELQEKIRRNTEWILLTHGLLYYYGVLNTSKILDRIRSLTEQKVEIGEYLHVIHTASDYYDQVRFSNGYLKDHRIFDEKKIIDQHKMRSDIDYYPFSKKQLLKAGVPGYIEKTPAMKKFLRFLLEHYDLTAGETDEIAIQMNNIIHMDLEPSMMFQYLQSRLEFPSFEFVQQLTEKMMDVYNNSHMWVLKGYTPAELSKKEKTHLNPVPSEPFGQAGTGTKERGNSRKIGRNDPCPCGSGKKYKKCCGKDQ